MSLRTYGPHTPIIAVDAPPGKTGTLAPGVWVTHGDYGGHGMVVAVNDDNVVVLWSQEPKGGFENFAFPLVRRVQPQLIAQEIMKIQPMTVPSGLTFYLDYQYGKIDEDQFKLEKRCNTGPLVSRMFWKAYKWTRQRTLSFGSSLRSWVRWPFGRRGTSESKRLLDKWSPVAGTKNGPEQQRIVEEYLKRHGSGPKTPPPGPSSCLR